ncbi:MAG: hypothetical protein B6226_04640 [Candidatus Cloacimonetes bacterium 4572_65]|nr:MAG: hypothetical protein B6226_04640 [Candidatus Cloacimonetes bacterium 4572_65]
MLINKNHHQLLLEPDIRDNCSFDKHLNNLEELINSLDNEKTSVKRADIMSVTAQMFLQIEEKFASYSQKEELLSVIYRHELLVQQLIFKDISSLHKKYNNMKMAYQYNELYFICREKLLKEELNNQNIDSSLKDSIRSRENNSKDYSDIIGDSKIILDILEMIELIANHNVNVFISGPSGSGKSLIAKTIHKHFFTTSPFVTIDCSSIPEDLLESELFGYKKGAFTGAIQDKKGKIEEAHNGVLFLDEISDMPVKLQTKLLRFIQEKSYYPIGSSIPKKISVRIISATNKDSAEMIKSGLFREDLFFRLNVLRIEIPQLSEHKSDIPLLINHFIGKFNHKFNKNISGCDPTIVKQLTEHKWEGDVRELKNCLERAVLLCKSNILTAELFDEITHKTPLDWNEYKTLKASLVAEKELDYVQNLLLKFDNNFIKASEYGGLRRTQLYRILKRNGK